MLIDARNRKIISDNGAIICKHGVSDILIINNDQTVIELIRDKNGDYCIDNSEFKEYREELKLLKVLIDMDLDKKEEQYEAV